MWEMYAQVPPEPEEGVRSPRDGVAHGSEVTDMVMEAGTESSKEQVFLVAESPP